jgi:hypothetical protein
MRYAHLDLDDPSDEALEKLRNYELTPTMIVFSGGGYNAYWQLDEPVHVNGNITELEIANKKLIADFGGDKGTYNLDRILRLPGTINYPSKTKIKRGRVPIEARLVEHNPGICVWGVEEFDYLPDPDDYPPEPAADSEPAKKKSAPTEPKKTAAKKDGDRSRDLLAKVATAVRNGLSDDEIHASLDSHPHCVDQPDPARAVQRCIDKARSEASSIIERISAENSLIWVNGKLLVMWHQIFERGLPRLSHIQDTKNYWKLIQHGKASPVDIWLHSSKRKEYSGFTFQPGAQDTGDKFNLFQGWGV